MTARESRGHDWYSSGGGDWETFRCRKCEHPAPLFPFGRLWPWPKCPGENKVTGGAK